MSHMHVSGVCVCSVRVWVYSCVFVDSKLVDTCRAANSQSESLVTKIMPQNLSLIGKEQKIENEKWPKIFFGHKKFFYLNWTPEWPLLR